MKDWDLRPARDHGLTHGDRLRSMGRERGLGSLAMGGAWRVMVRLYLRLAHGFRVEGLERLPPGPFVIVGNHTSHLDALSVAAALPRSLARQAYALAAGDTFFSSLPAATFAAYAVNALPVWRKRTTARDLDGMRQRLIEDRAVLILFPEGTRSRTGVMGRFQPGIGALVAGRPVPVVPCYLDGAFACWPASSRRPSPGRLRLVIGAPLRFEDTPATRAGMTEVAARCEAAVRALAPGTAATS
ncbi:MAG: lysophospholipid acyltransferase family protein [Janthinobacterium lividum]